MSAPARSRYLPLLFCLMMLLIPQESEARRRALTYQLSAVGDRSLVELKIKNASGRRQASQLGAEGQGVTDTLEPFSSVRYLIRCLRRRSEQPIPALTLTLDGREYPLERFAARPSDPEPIVWLSGDMKVNRLVRRGFLQLIRSVHPDAVIHELALRDISEHLHLQLLQRAPLLLIDLSSLLALDPQKQTLLRALVAAGATLVIGTGENHGASFALESFSDVLLGNTTQVGRTVSAKLRSVDGVRPLTARGEAYPLVIADGAPLVVEELSGMGRVRTVGVQLHQLSPGETADAVFRLHLGQRKQLETWIEGMMPPLSAPPHLLEAQLLWLLLFIPLLFFVARGRRRWLLTGSALWLLAALIESPISDPMQIERAQLLYLPMDRGGVVLGQLDLSFYERGFQSIPETGEGLQLSLLDTPNEGACQLHALDALGESWWLLQGQVGERQRFRFIAYVETLPSPVEGRAPLRMPPWPPGPWSDAPLFELAPAIQDLPLQLPVRSVQAWRLPQTPPQSEQPDPLILDDEPR